MSSSASASASFGLKRKRISRACDRCHRLGRKCAPSSDSADCQTCIDYGDACTYDRPQGKRGAKGKRSELPIDHDAILYLVDAYRAVLYGIYCFFSWPHFTADIHAKRYLTDPGFRATVLVVCAIASARIRDGASFSLPDTKVDYDSDALHTAAMAAVPNFPLGRPPRFDDLRASYLLCVLAMQNGDIEQSHAMMGRYMALSSLLHFHDEMRWPQDLQDHERQELRALYWSAFTHDVFISAVWQGMPQHRSWFSNVRYPDYIDEGSHVTGWIEGWNAVTDLYRAAEATMDFASMNLRPSIGSYHDIRVPKWETVRAIYDNLPAIFKTARAVTGNPSEDIFGFQQANLTCTLQSVRMAIAVGSGLGITERCTVAGELLESLATIPAAYMQAISAPLLQQLAAVGALLGTAVQSPITISGYVRIRQILLELASLLALLESTLKHPANVSARVFDHVERIDAFMKQETTGAEQAMLKDMLQPETVPEAPPLSPLPVVDPALAESLFTLPGELLDNWLFHPDHHLFDAFLKG